MAAEIHRLRVDHDGLFTDVEHAVLANWFGQQTPADAPHIKLDDALAQLGFEEPCEPYTQTAAAVAHVLLEAGSASGLGVLERGQPDPEPQVPRAAPEAATAGGTSAE
jgi:hypothetical protein